jgi:hypothetical protein
MKYLISLLVGMVVGVAVFLALLYYNPLTSINKLSPLSVTENELVSLNYSAVASDALIYTNDGASVVTPHPAKVLQLWEQPIRKTNALATVLRDGRNQVAGIGVKFSSDSESTNILNGEALVDSVWHVYLPGRGSFFIEQKENYWGYLREVVLPAYWSSGDSWRGNWNGSVTAGPGALGTSRVVGGSGEFFALDSVGVESLLAKAYSVDQGPVAVTGELTIEIPPPEVVSADSEPLTPSP